MLSNIRNAVVFAAVFAAALFPSALSFAAGLERQGEFRPVRLVTRGPEKPVELRALGIKSDIAGGYAWTNVEMTFFNPNSRVLEGELQFPLADGQNVTGFALSFGDGKRETMRSAVPVARQKGRQAFESIERRGEDPALLESAPGNNFKLRVYPLNPGGTRKVRLTYSELLPVDGDKAVYRLPLFAYSDKVESLSVEITSDAPVSDVSAQGELSPKVGDSGAAVTLEGRNVPLSGGTLSLVVPYGNKTASMSGYGGRTYFYARVPIPSGAIRKLPSSVAVLWDASLSGQKREHGLEFDLLDKFFAEAKNVSVDLQITRDVLGDRSMFEVRGGDWTALRKTLESAVYDGATNLGAFDMSASPDIYLLFSDGLDNYSLTPMTAPSKPLYAIVSSQGAGMPRLRSLSRDGGVIDLTAMETGNALRAVMEARPRLVAAEGKGLSDVMWRGAGADSYAVTGITDGSSEADVIFETPDGRRVTDKIYFKKEADADTGHNLAAPYLWASMKIESLDAEYALNRGEIRRLGEAFGVPTRETSLIVLETAEDYVRYDVAPPSELKDECDKLRSSGMAFTSGGEQNKIERVVKEWREREEWWNRDFPKGKMPKKEASGAPEAGDVRLSGRAEASRARNAQEFLSAPTPTASPVYAEMSEEKTEALRKQTAGAAAVTVTLRPWRPYEPYTRRMKEARDEDMYRVYLDERPDYQNSAAFYLDVSYQLRGRGLEDLSLRVLSNLAEMGLENRQILRVLGYRLLEAGLKEQAVMIFRQVMAIADDEPQSHRDLGLALEAVKDYQNAVNSLYDAAVRTYDRDFPGMEVIALAEMNAIIARAPGEIDVSAIDRRLISDMPLDLRVVLTWDSDNTDIDLHVTDPNGEEAFYRTPLTYQGGRVSPDNTSGYGPEEFSLKTAKPGKYRVDVNFYGHTQQIISESTTIQLDFFTRYGTKEQEKQSVTMRLKEASDSIFVGEFEALP